MENKKDPAASYAKSYKIHTVQNGTYFWDASGNPKELNTLILCKYHGGENQRFYLSPTLNGKWRINCFSNGFCLKAHSQKSESNLYFGTTNSTPDEEWELIELKANTYIIKGKNGLVIDVSQNNYRNQAKLITFAQHSGKNQQWILQKV